MRCRYLAITLVLAIFLSILGGCGEDNGGDPASGSMVYGEVSKIEKSTITIQAGTMNKSTQQPKQEKNDNGPGNEEIPLLNLTGEEKEIQLTDDTIVKKEQMGGPEDSGMGTPPESSEMWMPPDGGGKENPPGQPRPSGNGADNKQKTEIITIDDISEGDMVQITIGDDGNAAEILVMAAGGNGEMGFGKPGDFGQAGGAGSYTAVEEYTSDITVEGEAYTSAGTDENAIHVLDGAEAVLKNITVTRTSSDSSGGDNSSFYGVGAAVLTTEGKSYVSGSNITTDAAGAAGIFAYGDGVAYAADTTIKTQQDTSGGIHVAGGGILYAWDMDVETNGESSAAVRSDRGGGKMVIDGGTYTSNGTGSPAIYSTADIAVNGAELTAAGSEAICIEGLNSIHLYDSNLTGSMVEDSRNDCTWNVILYQSMSGDSEIGNSTFEMNGGTLTAKNGGMFYTTNTESTITLSGVDITNSSDSEFFLRCTGNHNQRGWGTPGKNGADCLFTAINQHMEGDIIWDSISYLDFYLTEGSVLKGAVADDETYAQNGGDGYCSIYVEKGSKWIVTGNSAVTNLYYAGTIEDTDGNTVTVKGNDGTVYVKGNSIYTITVGSCSTSVDCQEAASLATWSGFKCEKPSQLD